MLNLEDLLQRASSSLTKFLTKEAREILATDSEAMRPENLIKLIRDSISPYNMLKDQDTRNILIKAMSQKDAEDFARFVGISEWNDIYYKLTHTKFTDKTIKIALEFFGERTEEDKTYPEKPDTESIAPSRPLFDYQVNTVYKIQKRLTEKPYKVLLHMPTGAGKTISSMRIIIHHLLENPHHFVIWLAHNEELCEQAFIEFQKLWKTSGDRTINTYRFFGKSRIDPSKINNGFMVAGLQKMLASARRNNEFLARVSQKTSLVIIDEAHQAIAEKFSIVIEELSNNETKLLGLSATPGRKTEIMDEENFKLARFFDNQKIMLDTGDENPIRYLIKNSYLAEPRFNSITHMSKILTPQDMNEIRKHAEIPYKILEKLSIQTMRNLAIITEIIRLAKIHKKIIVFATSVDHAKTLSQVLAAKKYKAYYITHKTPSGTREKILYNYKNTYTPMILCNYGILTTGFDAPQTSAIVIARPTKSSVLYAQMVGRGIRGERAGGNKTCEISTVKDEIDEFINVTEVFTQWETAWNE